MTFEPSVPAGTLLAFWAKTDGGSRSSPRYHPLLFHMLDVAFTARAIWQHVLTPASRQWFGQQLGADPQDVEQWVAFTAGAHDIGKASPAFQWKSPVGWERLVASGFPAVPPVGNEPHGLISAWCLQRESAIRHPGLNDEVAPRLAQVVGGHHGQIPCPGQVYGLGKHAGACGSGAWSDARIQMLSLLAGELGGLPLGGLDALPNAAAMTLAGLISVSDWIGSNQLYFPCASDDDGVLREGLLEYTATIEGRVIDALKALGWLGWRPQGAIRDFRELFPAISQPNHMQLAVEHAAAGVTSPSIFIIEAAMGQGKTEAAMYLANRWSSSLGQRGAYFALPTQATSNQMYGRVREFLLRIYPDDIVNLQLLHGLSSLSGELAESRRAADYSPVNVDADGDSAHGDVIAAEWFAHRKRGLLAPFGVGTVDQAMYAVLQVKHGFVRLFGLAQKTVILDEVHAYDTYMTEIIEDLVRWLGSLGSSVVLLSATLPAEKRRSLLDAYLQGAGYDAEPQAESVPYPRITWASAGGAATVHTASNTNTSRTVAIEWIDGLTDADPDRGGAFLAKLSSAMQDGGCAAVICNTVKRVQQVYSSLKPYFPEAAVDGHAQLDLLHARYTYRDRRRHEQRTLRRFGKPDARVGGPGDRDASVQRPQLGILVSTQVIEQSLDLDFDLMVSDMAPADLILQRIGRLHRHELRSARPQALRDATVWLNRPAMSHDGVPIFEPGTQAVYDPYVLLRSWLALADCAEISIPADIEPIVEDVYGELRRPLSQPLMQALATAFAASEKKLQADKNEAIERKIKGPGYGGDLCQISRNGLEEEDPALNQKLLAVTRLTGPTVNVVLLYGDRDSPRLDPEATDSIDFGRKPGLREARQLLERSLTISNWAAVWAILGQIPQPPAWEDSALLRFHYPLMLDARSRCQVGELVLAYDTELGLTIDRKGDSNA